METVAIMPFLPYLLAGCVGFMTTLIELITSIYPRTYHFLRNSTLYICLYSGLYGIFSVIMMLLVEYGYIKLEGIGVSNILIQSLLVGITIRALLHIRIFSYNTGSELVPIGTETILLPIESWLLKEIGIGEYNTVKEYTDKTETCYKDFDNVKREIKRNIPSTNEQEITTFSLDIDKTENISEAMSLYIRQFGKKSFDRVFPMKK